MYELRIFSGVDINTWKTSGNIKENKSPEINDQHFLLK